MELQCDICFLQFDLDNHRPKVLPCGHTICKQCVENPALGRKCPVCRKNMAVGPDGLPDNILAIRAMEKEAEPPCKVPRREVPEVRQLLRGVEAGRKLVQELRRVVPMAVKALDRQLDSAVAQLRRMEEALGKMRREDAGDAAEGLTPDLVQAVVQLEDSVRLLSAHKCGVVAEHGGDTWRASGVELSPNDHALRLLLLQLRSSSRLQKVHAVVGPPRLSVLSIERDDIDDDMSLKVGDILQNGPRWKNIRTLRNLNGHNTEKLLRVVAPHLEELEISSAALIGEMEEVQKMTALKRLLVECDVDCDAYPDLPLQLEELSMCFPSTGQLRCVQRMHSLRSLRIDFYCGDPVSFRPRQQGGLLWLGVNMSVDDKNTMLSLIRANASSLQELHIDTHVKEDGNFDHYFPDLGQDLATCDLQALRRLVLRRPNSHSPCGEVDACLLQRQTISGFFPSCLDVICYSCQKSYVLG
ncbi:uncharacterized protein LOC113217070 isoform X2 [Frankliniella occidentalis]|nr:uncharacterized protein LOC113217070 isoform X2 [Frankliniella occidentalis]